jgi:hypothetical protein
MTFIFILQTRRLATWLLSMSIIVSFAIRILGLSRNWFLIFDDLYRRPLQFNVFSISQLCTNNKPHRTKYVLICFHFLIMYKKKKSHTTKYVLIYFLNYVKSYGQNQITLVTWKNNNDNPKQTLSSDKIIFLN